MHPIEKGKPASISNYPKILAPIGPDSSAIQDPIIDKTTVVIKAIRTPNFSITDNAIGKKTTYITLSK